MYDKLEKINALEDNLEDFVDDFTEDFLEDFVEDEAKDITDRFDLKDEETPNLEVRVNEASCPKARLTKLSSFLKKNNFRKESYEVLKLANISILDDGNELKEKLKREVLNTLAEEYSENCVDWNYDTDFRESIFELGFSDLEKQFAQLMDDGLASLEDLSMDEASEVLWAASGLTPEGHHDFDNNLISLQDFQNEDLNRQTERPGRDEVLEVRDEIAKKFSEWVEYREPNLESLEDLEFEDLLNKIKTDLPSLSGSMSTIYEEWEEFLDSIPDDQRQLFEDESFSIPEEVPLYGDTSSYEKEEPVGTSGDLERLEEKRYGQGYEDLQDYI